MQQTELVVLGGGPAGYTCAIQCARRGIATTLVERSQLGGTGLYSGCLPVKYLLDRLRWQVAPREQSEAERDRRCAEIFDDCRRTMAEVSSFMLRTLESTGVRVVLGEPEFTGPGELIVHRYDTAAPERVSFVRAVLATGTQPVVPRDVTVDQHRVMTHAGAVDRRNLPASLAIVGGDVEGLEFASLFSELGTRVTVLELQPSFLSGADRDLVEPVLGRLRQNGVELRLDTEITGIEVSSDECTVKLKKPASGPVAAQAVLLTAGRSPALPRGLERTGVRTRGKGAAERVVVDASARTSQDSIFCIGDLNGRLEMGHAAIQQGFLLAEHLAGGPPPTWDYSTLPRVMFTLPQQGGAGMQEIELKQQAIPYRKAVVPFDRAWRGFGHDNDGGFLKLLVREDTGSIAGAWFVGAEIRELVNAVAPLVDAGMTVAQATGKLWVHPSMSEVVLQALMELS